jgi:hypothetical protein
VITTRALAQMPEADQDAIRALATGSARVYADLILPSGYRITATEANHAVAALRLLDVLDGQADCPTDPAALAPLIDVASTMEAVRLWERLAQMFPQDQAETERRWGAAADLLTGADQ